MLQGERELCTGAPGEPGMEQAGKQLLLHEVLTLGGRQGWGMLFCSSKPQQELPAAGMKGEKAVLESH